MNTKYDKEWSELILKYAWELGLRGFALWKCKRRWAKALREFQREYKGNSDNKDWKHSISTFEGGW